MKTWTQQAGLPLVTVSRLSPSMLEISQAWYRNPHLSTDQSWAIPLTWVNLAGQPNISWDLTSPDLWLLDTTAQVKVEEGFIPLLNKKAVGQ